jgi:hypothetical protein
MPKAKRGPGGRFVSTKKKSTKKRSKRVVSRAPVSGASYTVVSSKPIRKRSSGSRKRGTTKTKTRTVVRTVRVAGRRTYRKAKAIGGIRVITSNKKETIVNIAALGAGFVGTMALVNLAPIPSTFKPKWKGAILAGLAIFAALKVKDKRLQLGFAGAATYGIIDLARNYIPGIAALGTYDNRAVLLGMAMSRSSKAIGTATSRSAAAIGAARNAAANRMVRVPVVPSSNVYKGSNPYTSVR